MKSNPTETAKDLAGRLVREPFLPFSVELQSAERLNVGARWQAMTSEEEFVYGEPSEKMIGCVTSARIIPLEQITVIENLKQNVSDETKPVVAAAGMVRLFTDGACQGNPGPGGWGFIIKNGDGIELGRGSGGERPTTNNRMELTCVIRGLEMLDPTQSVKLITDSQYVAKGLSEWMAGWKKRGWKRKTAKGLEPVANEDLWRQLDELVASRKIVCEWVRGHAGHPENEECDQMAVEAAMNL
jgi:ribonuclease HI